MILSVSKFKQHRVLPVLALVTAVLLISGQILNCCRLNESISASLTRAFQSVGIIPAHKAQVAQESEIKSHPNCHGHGSESGVASNASITQPIEPGQNNFEAEESCLSERTFTVNAQPSSPLSLIDLPVQVHIGYVDAFVRLHTQVDRPRPQNKSSPPLYLLTLRILV